MIFRKQTREQSLKGKYHNKWWKKFAWLPVELITGQTIWLESYWQYAYYSENISLVCSNDYKYKEDRHL